MGKTLKRKNKMVSGVTKQQGMIRVFVNRYIGNKGIIFVMGLHVSTLWGVEVVKERGVQPYVFPFLLIKCLKEGRRRLAEPCLLPMNTECPQ